MGKGQDQTPDRAPRGTWNWGDRDYKLVSVREAEWTWLDVAPAGSAPQGEAISSNQAGS